MKYETNQLTYKAYDNKKTRKFHETCHLPGRQRLQLCPMVQHTRESEDSSHTLHIKVFTQVYYFVICNVNLHVVLNDASTFSNRQL